MAGTVLDKSILGKPHEKYWVSYIKQRISQNKNFLGFLSGPTGSGKSWSSLSICEDIDKDFNIDRVVFGGIELMKLINSGTLKKGSCICFEEVGIEMNNHTWQSATNRMLNFLMQTFRHKNFVLILNSPYMDFVDSATRKLFHAELLTKGIDLETNECILKPHLIQYNSRMQKFYYKRLKVITYAGKVPVDVWRVHKPSTELIHQYEEKKTAFTNRLNQEICQELERVQETKNKRNRISLTEIQQETLDLLKLGYNVEQIATAKGRARSVIDATIRLIKLKGYQINAIYEGSHVIRYDIIEPGQMRK